ncbi:TPA: YadA-like family protein [Mannheimia haemolytica]
MNKIYKVIWNTATQGWVAVSELGKAHKKSKSKVDLRLKPASLMLLSALGGTVLGQQALAATAIANGKISYTNSDSTQVSQTYANARKTGSIAIGDANSTANDGNVTCATMAASIAIGMGAKAVATAPIGDASGKGLDSYSQAVAIGRNAWAKGDQSVALGADTRALGHSSIAIGGDDLDSVAGVTYSNGEHAWANSPYSGINTSELAKKFNTLTGEHLVDLDKSYIGKVPTDASRAIQYTGTNASQAAVAIGVSAVAKDLATSFGTRTYATDIATALGVGAKADRENSVALGAGSVTKTDASNVNDVTVNGVTYGGFAAADQINAGDQVSVGGAGFERQIKNVAAGHINDKSTDAINGSQLYQVIDKAGWNLQENSIQKDLVKAGDIVNFVNGTGTTVTVNTTSDGKTSTVKYDVKVDNSTIQIKNGVLTANIPPAVAQQTVENYFHVNNGKNTGGDSTTNLGNVDVSAGATVNTSLAAGINVTATKQKAAAVGYNTSANGVASVAIGSDSVANSARGIVIGSGASTTEQGIGIIAIGANATADAKDAQAATSLKGATALAIGANTQAIGTNNIAVGTSSIANGTGNATAVGQSAEASGDASLAVGNTAKAKGQGSTALGLTARALKNQSTALGSDAEASGDASLAIGPQSRASGDTSMALGSNSTASGTNANAIGMASKATGGKANAIGVGATAAGFDSVAIGTNSSTADGTQSAVALGQGATASATYASALGGASSASAWQSTAVGAGASASGNYSVALGESSAKGNSAVSVGLSSLAEADNTIAIGGLEGANDATKTKATAAAAIAIGKSAQATHANAVALGESAKTAAAVGTSSATVNGISYSGFAGTNPQSVVSIGDVGKERQLINVAAGRISDTSTDAINGSQLYQVIKTAGWKLQENNAEKDVVTAGDVVNFVNGTGTTVNITTTNGNVSKVTYSVDTGTITVDENTGNVTTPKEDNKVATTQNVADAIKKAGWTATSSKSEGEVEGTSNELVNPGDTVTFDAGKNIKIKQAAGKFTVSTKDDVKFNNVTSNSVNVPTGGDNSKPISVTKDGMDMADKPITNVTNGLTTYNDGAPNGLVNLTNPAVDNKTVATVGDLRNMGWIVSSDKTTGDEVGKPTDTAFTNQVKNANEVKFVGTGIAKVSGKKGDDGVNTITVHVEEAKAPETAKISPNTTTGTAGTGDNGSTEAPKNDALVTAGDVINVVNNTFWKVSQETADNKKDDVKAGDNVIFAKGTGTTVSVENTDGVNTTVKYSVDTGEIKVDDTTGNVTKPTEPNKVATTQNVAEAIQKSGFKLSVEDGTNTTVVNPGEVVDLNNTDNNIVITKNNNDNNVTFNLNNTVKLGNNPNNQVTIDGNNNTISGLNSTLPATNSTAPTDANNTTAQKKPDNIDDKKNNAATVDDVLNAGWNLQENGAEKDFVKAYDTVNFVNGTGTIANISMNADGTIANVTFNVANTTLKASEAPTAANNNTPIGKIEAPTEGNKNNFVNAGDLATAINSAGFTVYENNATLKATVTAGDQVSFNNGTYTTAVVEQENAAGRTNVTFNVDGAKIVSDNSPVVYTDKKGNKVYPVTDEKGNTTFNTQPDGKGDKVEPSDVIASMQNADGNNTTKPMTLTNVANGTTTLNGDNRGDKAENPTAIDKTTPLGNNLSNAYNGLADLINAPASNAVTVGDLRNLGWVVSATGNNYADDVRNANEVRFVGQNGLAVTGETDKDGVRVITVSANAGSVVPTEAVTTADNKPVVKVGDNYYKTEDIDSTTGKPKQDAQPIPADQVKNTPNAGNSLVTGNQVADAIQVSGFVVGKQKETLAVSDFKNEDERVNPDDHLRFADGKSTIASLATKAAVDASGKVVTTTTVKVDVDLPIDYKYTDKDGNEVVKHTDGKFYPADPTTGLADTTKAPIDTAANPVTKDGAKLTNGSEPAKPYEQHPDFDSIEQDKKDVLQPGKGGVNLNNVAWANEPDQAVNKDQLDQTVAKSGFFVKQNGESTLAANKGSKDDDKTEKVTPNDVVNFVNGTNTQVSATTEFNDETGQDVTNVRVDVVGLPVTYTTKEGDKVAKAPDGNYYKVDPTTGLPKVEEGSKVEPNNIVASMVNPNGDNTTAPTTLTNVAAGTNTLDGSVDNNGKPLVKYGDQYYTPDQLENGKPKDGAVPSVPAKTVDAYNGLADLDTVSPSNAMTVADAKKLGWIVSADGNNYADDVRNANEVKFKGEGLATVTGATNTTTGVREITVSVKTGDVTKSNEFVVQKDGVNTPVVKVGDNYYTKENIDPTTGKPKDGAEPVNTEGATIVNNGAGLVTGNQVADAIQASGFTVGKGNTEGVTFDNKDEKVNPDDELRFADSDTTTVALGTTKRIDPNGEVKTTTTVKVDVANTGLDANDKGSLEAPKNDADKKKFVNAGDLVNAINKTGFTLTTSGNAQGSTEELVNPGEKVTLDGGNNIELTQTGNTISIATKDNVTFGEKGADGKPGKDGSVGVNGKDGSAVTLNGKDGSIGLNGKDGKDGLSLKSADGAQGVNGKDGENGLPDENGTTRLVYQPTNPDGTPNGDPEQIANLNDGLIFTGNNEELNRHKLNTVVKVVGEGVDKAASEAFKSASGNINVKANGTDTLEVQLAKALDLTQDGSVTTGNTTVNNDGLTIKNGPSVTKTGINAGDKKVTNVADGEISATSKDAVNGSQLHNALQNTGWDLTVDGNVAENSGSTRVANNGKVTIKGGDNIVVSRKVSKDGSEVTVATSMTPKFDKVTANEVKVGDVTINNNGINAGNKQITNVADGVKDTDAVNVRQLKQVKGDVVNINNKVDKLDKRVRGIGASSAAAASLPQVYIPGKSMVAAAGGAYGGASAVAVGYSRASDNGKLILKLQGTANSEGNISAGAGVGYQW